MLTMTEAQIARRTELWNAIMPKKIVALEDHPTYFRALTPTKGWKYVSKRRLGL